MQPIVCSETQATWGAACVTCALCMTATAIGSFVAGALFSASTHPIRRILSQLKNTEKEAAGSTPKKAVCDSVRTSNQTRPPPKRRHSIAVHSSVDRSNTAILAARHSRAYRSAATTDDVPGASTDKLSSAGTEEDDEERDAARPLSSAPRGVLAMHQKGRSFAASLRKLTLLHDNSVEQARLNRGAPRMRALRKQSHVLCARGGCTREIGAGVTRPVVDPLQTPSRAGGPPPPPPPPARQRARDWHANRSSRPFCLASLPSPPFSPRPPPPSPSPPAAARGSSRPPGRGWRS